VLINKKVLFIALTMTALSVVSLYVYKSHFSHTEAEVKKDSIKLQQYNDSSLGYSIALPTSYKARNDTVAPNNSGVNIVTKNYERSDPQGFLSIRYESGLSKGANILKKPLLDFVQGEIESYFPSKYKEYRPLSMARTEINGKSSLLHEFEYISTEGKPLRTNVLVVPYDNDSAYYVIFQAHRQNYPKIMGELSNIHKSLKLDGPNRDR
jgi:hypothetical protein